MDGASKPVRVLSNMAKAPTLFDGSSGDEPLAGPVDGASKPARVLPDQFARAGEASAARDLLYESRLGSFHQLSLHDHVEYRWLLDLSAVSSSRLLRATRVRVQDLMRRPHNDQCNGTVQCLLFTWYIMSDETPWRVRVSSVVDHAETTESSLAKVMATQTVFSCVLKVAKASGEDGASHPAASEGSRCGAPQPAAHDYLIIHGRVPTQLRAMQ